MNWARDHRTGKLLPMEPNCCATIGIDPGDPIHALLLLSTGLTTSFGHCLGMCGPLQTAVAAAPPPSGGRIASTAIFHAGRLASYASIGAALGLAGPILRGAGSAQVAQALVSIAAGLVMLAFVFGARAGRIPSGGFPGRAAQAIVTWMRTLLGSSRRSHRFFLGVANGLLPCGPVALVAVAAASSQGPGQGALALLLFGAGTVPVLVALAFGSAWIGASARAAFARVGTFLVVMLSAQLVLRGSAALGFIRHLEIGRIVVW